MPGEAPKTAKEAFVPKYEIAAGLHKGRRLEKFIPKQIRPTRRLQVRQTKSIELTRLLNIASRVFCLFL
jgi:hypothetical protein